MRLIFISLLLIGCAEGNCRQQKSPADIAKLENSNSRIKIYKADGSKQCEKTPGLTLEKMADEIKNIQIFSSVKQDDGQMHVTLCGSSTGKINVYEIDAKDLPAAEKKGFKKLQ